MSNFKTIHGTHGNDNLDYRGYHHKYEIYGQGGNDYIYGGHKNDKLFGEHGNDFLYGEGGNDKLDGGYGNDYLYGGHGNDKLLGGEGNDYLVGNGGQDYFDGGYGTDMVSYYDYKGDIHADLKKGVVSSSSSHYKETLKNIEDFTGGSGNDKIKGDHGKNTLHGGEGHDKLFGRGGDDYLYGGYGNDKLKGDKGDDYLNGGYGNDKLKGGKGDDYLNGGWGHDTLYGEHGHDNILGDIGNDKLVGGDGNDTLDGYGASYYVAFGGTSPRSNESDTLTGGHGADVFVLGSKDFTQDSKYYLGHGHATITDFDSHEGDTIQLLGSSSHYHLSHEHFSGGDSLDTLIKSNGDLIAVVEDTTHLNFHQDFTFV
ncbi:MAG: calcium-binding protein [Cyanobacteria bacterium P01_H01_bin.150]